MQVELKQDEVSNRERQHLGATHLLRKHHSSSMEARQINIP